MTRKKSDIETAAENVFEISKKLAKIGFSAAKSAAKTGAEVAKDYALLARRMTPRERFQLLKLRPYVSPEEFNAIKSLLKQNKLRIRLKRYGWSFLVSGKDLLPCLISEFEEVKQLDKRVRYKFFKERFDEFVERSWGALPQYIASDVIGLLEIKQAISLQMFSTEQVHILLIGDDSRRKESMLLSASELAPVSTYGSFSKLISDLFQTRQMQANEINNGLNCFSDLHELSDDEKKQLAELMDKQFISYDTKRNHFRYDLTTSILASASPKEGKFEEMELGKIREKIPFDPDFLSNFNLTFVVREVNLDHFAEIAEKILTEEKAKLNKADINFIKRYISYARKINVKLPPKLSEVLRDFAVGLKHQEENMPVSVTQNTVAGILRLAKASARMELRDTIEAKDLERVFNIYNKALNFSKN